MKVKFYAYGDEYEVSDGSRHYVSLKNLTSGADFLNFCTRNIFEGRIQSGEIIVVAEETKAEPLPIKIEVDATSLDKALATAKELEATLLRIKELWPCSGS